MPPSGLNLWITQLFHVAMCLTLACPSQPPLIFHMLDVKQVNLAYFFLPEQ